MLARIYQPSRNVMQSGQANAQGWVLEFISDVARGRDPLMGWTGCEDMRSQVKLRFNTQTAAVAYARARDIDYRIVPTRKRQHVVRRGGYGENFAPTRKTVWTH